MYFQESKDELPSTTKKRRSRRPAVANTGPRRQTRAVTRAANDAKVGKRQSSRRPKTLIKIENDLDSEDDSNHRPDDEEEEDNAIAGDDVFQEPRQPRQGGSRFLQVVLVYSFSSKLTRICRCSRNRPQQPFRSLVSKRHEQSSFEHALDDVVLTLSPAEPELLPGLRNEGE